MKIFFQGSSTLFPFLLFFKGPPHPSKYPLNQTETTLDRIWSPLEHSFNFFFLEYFSYAEQFSSWLSPTDHPHFRLRASLSSIFSFHLSSINLLRFHDLKMAEIWKVHFYSLSLVSWEARLNLLSVIFHFISTSSTVLPSLLNLPACSFARYFPFSIFIPVSS